tara:strand:+ start:765 stop:2960 length:2196 start_codon:yes stop_codon:yes gene_type:complete
VEIKKVVVIGSGTMGGGIAAQVANAGIEVVLLDLPSKEGSRNQITEYAKERILKSRPPLLVEKNKINLISAGNIEDNFNEVSQADWVVEAVVERIDIKHNIYKKIDDFRKLESIISSNTSTIPLKVLSAKMSDKMKKNFCITHFFNPVRYMGLLEIVTESFNEKGKIDSLKSFCDEKLGKGVIICKDTPGFLGNRVGVYAIQVAMTEAFAMGLTIEEADAIFGRPMGIPKTGVFGLYDLIGIDLMADVLKSFIKELPDNDPFQEVAKEIPLIKKLISDGYTGRKGKGGFYRMQKRGEQKFLESINLKTGEYSKVSKVDLGIGDQMNLNELINIKGKFGDYAKNVINKITDYASSLIPNVTDNRNNIDEAMRLGFNWTIGPFEMLEETNKSKKSFELKQSYLDNNLNTLRRIKNNKSNFLKKKNNSANLYYYEPKDYNLVEFVTKANALDGDSMEMLQTASNNNLIIINDSLQFSAGVNLNYVMEYAKNKQWNKVEKFIIDFQKTCKTLKYSKYPVISAPSGLAIGGGFEVLVQSNYVVSHTNVVLGLVETLVGLIPAGGGCKELLWRWLNTEDARKNPQSAALKVFNIIGYAQTANSPIEALPNKFLLEKDRVVINKDRLLHEAEKLLEKIKKDYKPPEEPKFSLPGSSVRDEMHEILEKLHKDKKILDHGLEVGKQLAFVLSGGNTNLEKELNEDDMYKLELEAFMNLIQMPKTQERIKHTLETGKPLVN